VSSVKVENLRKIQKQEAVNGVSFLVSSGEFFCLLGPPGAGKTTLLRLIAGLERPSAGDIYLGEDLVNEVAPGDRDVAMVFEDVALYPHLTAYENIAYPLRLRRIASQEIDRKVKEVAESLRISHILNRRPQTFSGGELRRVAIGRALVRRPRVLLLDQPLTDLDAKIRQEMTGELKRIQKEVNQTMIYATHDFEEAVTMADRIMVVNDGQEEQLGTPEEVYKRPRTPLVARLVGSPSMNILSCQLKVIDNQLTLENPAFRLKIPDISNDQLPQEILVGIRPEHVAISKGEESILATVDIVQPLGDQQIVDLRLEDGTVIKIVAPLETDLSIEERIQIEFPLNRVVLFDGRQNTRIDLGRSAQDRSTA
jgi:ABC-type sugar transport system ATPase subunit